MSMRLRIATSTWQRLRGLLGRCPTWLADDEALCLVPCASVHTFGMRYPIDIAFIDREGFVIESRERVAPRSRLGCRGACAVLERFSDAPSCAQRGVWPCAGDRLVFLSR